MERFVKPTAGAAVALAVLALPAAVGAATPQGGFYYGARARFTVTSQRGGGVELSDAQVFCDRSRHDWVSPAYAVKVHHGRFSYHGRAQFVNSSHESRNRHVTETFTGQFSAPGTITGSMKRIGGVCPAVRFSATIDS